MWVVSLGWEDPLEQGMETHSSILAWRIPWTEEPSGLSPRGRKEPDTTEATQLMVALQCCVSFLQYKLAPLNMSLFSLYEK